MEEEKCSNKVQERVPEEEGTCSSKVVEETSLGVVERCSGKVAGVTSWVVVGMCSSMVAEAIS